MKPNLFASYKEVEIYVSKLLLKLENKSFTRVSNSINNVTQFSLQSLGFSAYNPGLYCTQLSQIGRFIFFFQMFFCILPGKLIQGHS